MRRLTTLEHARRDIVRLVDVEERHVVPELVVELRVRILHDVSALYTHVARPDNKHAHLKRDRAPAARAQTTPAVHTHHAGPVPARRVIAHGPVLVVLSDVLANLHLQLRLHTCHADGRVALWTCQTRGLDVGSLATPNAISYMHRGRVEGGVENKIMRNVPRAR